MARSGNESGSSDREREENGDRQCPDSEVRKPLRHALMRTSESKGHCQRYATGALLNLKFATEFAACRERTSGSGHQRTNLIVLAVVMVVVVVGVWLVNAIIGMRKAQECVESGRRNCAPIVVAPER